MHYYLSPPKKKKSLIKTSFPGCSVSGQKIQVIIHWTSESGTQSKHAVWSRISSIQHRTFTQVLSVISDGFSLNLAAREREWYVNRCLLRELR